LNAAAGPGHLLLDVPRTSRSKAAFFSFLFPGLGQAYRQQRRSAFYTGAFIAATDLALDAHARRERHDQRREDLLVYFVAGGLSVEEAQALDHAWERREKATRDLEWSAGLAGGIWLLSFVDALVSQDAAPYASSDAGITLLLSPSGRQGLAWAARF
jgi:hypothetical protein